MLLLLLLLVLVVRFLFYKREAKQCFCHHHVFAGNSKGTRKRQTKRGMIKGSKVYGKRLGYSNGIASERYMVNHTWYTSDKDLLQLLLHCIALRITTVMRKL